MQQNEYLFDVLIIGGGPAGLGAALALSRVCRTVALFDSHEYRNEQASSMHNVLCHDGEKPEDFRLAAMKQLTDNYNTITSVDTEITGVKHVMDDRKHKHPHFQVENHKGLVWSGRKLILASGVEDMLPDIEGYRKLWGRGIVHCVFCDGFERRGGSVGVLGLQSPKELAFALMAFPLSQDGVTIFTNGTPPDDDTTRKTLEAALTHGAKLDNRTIKSISEGPHGIGLQLHFHEGEDQHLHMLLHTPPTVNRAAILIQSLGLETQLGPDPFVVPKSPMGATSLRGCFVAGDTSTSAKIVPIAISSGSIAGIGAAMELAHDDT